MYKARPKLHVIVSPKIAITIYSTEDCCTKALSQLGFDFETVGSEH